MTEPLKDDDLSGTKIGEYEVLARVGAGGMGVVYEGIQPVIGKRVAVKVLRPQLSRDQELVDRFLAEARAVNAIRHRGIVDIFSFGALENGARYFVMEYLEGQAFDRLIRHKAPLLAWDVLGWIDEILDALEAVHGTGIVHRDIKPSNLFLVKTGRGQPYVKLLDFGIAKLGALKGGQTPETRASVLIGTPDYMAPEQARGETISPATDLYALGCVVFEMLTGRRVFKGENPMQTMFMHVEQAPPLVSDLLPDTPEELDDLVAWMLEKNVSKRPASATELRPHFDAVRKMMPSDKTESYTPPPPPSRPAQTTATPASTRARPPSSRSRAPAPADLGKTLDADTVAGRAAEAAPSPRRTPRRALAGAVLAVTSAALVYGVMKLPHAPPTPLPAPVEVKPLEPPPSPTPPKAAAPEPDPAPPAPAAAPEAAAPAKVSAPTPKARPHAVTTPELAARLAGLQARVEKVETARGSKDLILRQFLDRARTQISEARTDDARRDTWRFLTELDKQLPP